MTKPRKRARSVVGPRKFRGFNSWIELTMGQHRHIIASDRDISDDDQRDWLMDTIAIGRAQGKKK